MRKDVRIGAIIGGVFVAVLVVYAIIASTTHKSTKAVVIDGAKPSPTGPNSGGAFAAPTPDTSAPPHDDHSDAGATPTRNSSTPAPGGVPTTPIPGSSPATPTIGDRATVTPSDPAASRSAANWAALLSADHLEAEFQPVTTRTPDPAAAPVDPVPNTVAVDVPPDVAQPGQVADATVPGGGSTGGSGIGSSDSTSGSRTTPPVTAAQTHKIQAGETFSSIARAVYGDAKYFKEIVKANPSVDPSHLRLGMLITLPDSSQFKHDAKPAEKDATARHSAAPGTQPAVNPKTEYRVQSTDSLYKISLKLYGNANKVDAIYQLNKAAIGSDPAKLKLNMVLKLPEPPTETASSR